MRNRTLTFTSVFFFLSVFISHAGMPPHIVPVAPADICSSLVSSQPTSLPPSIKEEDQPVRVLAFGDFGNGSSQQKQLSDAMFDHHTKNPFDFGITLGDNFYNKGLNSPTHSRWKKQWEDLYTRLGIRIYATLGNHDYRDAASPGAEMQRSQLSTSWCMPKPFYTFTAGPVQFFAIDTDPMQRDLRSVPAQLQWLETGLRNSSATWKVVYGHHPVYTNGEHGKESGVLSKIKNRLLPLLRNNKVDIYLAGRDHDLQHLKPEDGVNFFISGGGGKGLRPLKSTQCRYWADSAYGFTVLEADAKTFTVSFIGRDNDVLHSVTLKKGHQTIANCSR